MANQSRTQQRSAAPGGRFGRGPSSKGTTSGRSLRARSGEAGAKGRFGLGGSLGPGSYGRPGPGRSRSSASNVAGWRRKSRGKASRQSGVDKALSAFTAVTGGKAAKKSASRSAKPAGFALLAGAAGLALKNRDRLKGLANRGEGTEQQPHAVTTGSAYTGATPGPQEDNQTASSPMGTTEGTMANPPGTLTDPPSNGSRVD